MYVGEREEKNKLMINEVDNEKYRALVDRPYPYGVRERVVELVSIVLRDYCKENNLDIAKGRKSVISWVAKLGSNEYTKYIPDVRAYNVENKIKALPRKDAKGLRDAIENKLIAYDWESEYLIYNPIPVENEVMKFINKLPKLE